MYLAIDGGGTKTEYLLLDEEFRTVGRYFGGCVNHDFLADGWEGTRQELQRGTEAVLAGTGMNISDIRYVAAGLSGVDNGKDQEQMEEIFREIGFAEYFVCNDGFLAVWAECPAGVGIAYNCGTGVCCAGIDEAGRMEKTAGLDEWSGDAGGGIWIVQNVFRLVYRSVVYGRKETSLAAAYKKKFSLETEEDILNSWNMLKDPAGYPEWSREVITLFFAQLEEGDQEIWQLAGQMALCAAENIGAVMERLVFSKEPVPVVLTGSVLTKAANKTYLTLLEERAREATGVPFRFIMASKPPVEGACRKLSAKQTKSCPYRIKNLQK